MRYWSYYASQLPPQNEEDEAEAQEPERETAPPASHPLARARRGRGQPLSPGLRARLERELNTSLSGVQVYHDPKTADSLGARAFTDGQDIVLGSAADQENLLAHESAHIAQARRRGVAEGMSQPGGATEREAQEAAGAFQQGAPVELAAGGSPVTGLMRQEKSGAEGGANLLAKREAVRFMLILQYQQQGKSGPLKLTPKLRSELRRLLPAVDDAALAHLWSPEPKGPVEAFERLSQAGFLPLIQAAPKEPAPPPKPPKEEEPVPDPGEEKPKVAFTGITGLGIHLVLNPQPPAPVSAVIRHELVGRGLSLSYRQVQSLLAGRQQGVEQLDRILKEILPGMGKESRKKLAGTIADTLITRSIKGQLRRELPGGQERSQEIEDRLQQALDLPRETSGGVLDLLKQVPVGVSVTVHF